MSWKGGRIFSKNGTRGRWWYWKGSKRGKVWKSLKAGKPTRFDTRLHTKRRRR